ncbi:hypothetical protein BTO15_07730 [Polaribacter sejongensis]|uniref:Uncharacterized protein n=1 Tax=Polaribacter sejongensis TaxID=985043 RepID=A0ABM6PYS1_9FLAO|nr:hypothetical protein [Polaribacter sejongensis]AUC21995.1 hypothetical protein BTO15_07730 [Polaribacter sejongensis]
MDLGTIIIGVICIALCALPFVLTNRNKKNKEKEILNSLKEFAKQHDSEITEHEISECYAIGLDKTKHAISFLQKTKDQVNLQFIDLSTIKNSEINNISKSIGKNETTLDKLNLKLNVIGKNKPSIVLEFYNSDINFQPGNEFDSIEKWNKIINSLLQNQQQNKAA